MEYSERKSVKGKMSTRMDNTSHFLDSRMEASIEIEHLFQFMNFFAIQLKISAPPVILESDLLSASQELQNSLTPPDC